MPYQQQRYARRSRLFCIHNTVINNGYCSISSIVTAIFRKHGTKIHQQPFIAAIHNEYNTYLQQSIRRQLLSVTSNLVTKRNIFTKVNIFNHSRISLCTTMLSQSPTIFQLQPQPQPQHQQLRTFVRRRKRQRAEKLRRRRVLQRRRGYPIHYQHHSEKRFVPLTFRTHIGRVLNKATRGERKIEFLIDFVQQYMDYNLELRKSVIIPYIRENFHRIAYEHFFLRILRSITFENNNAGINGFNFVIQFRTDLMEVIYDKVNELKTLDSKENLMRLRLSQYDKLKRVIRKEMSEYILQDLSSQPFPITIPDARKEWFTPNSANRQSKTSKHNSQGDNKTNTIDRLHEAGHSGPNHPAETIDSKTSDTESTLEPSDEQSSNMLGCVRRVDYNELTARFMRKCERKDPMVKSMLLGPNKMAYGWYQTDESLEPDVLIFISLQESIPRSLVDILVPEGTTETTGDLNVATFYSILIVNPALEKIGLGEYMIRPVIQKLLNDPEIPLSINKFSTLLPLYSFHNWLLSNDFEDDISLLVINDTSDDFKTLMHEWECPKEQVFRRLKALLYRNYKSYQETIADKPIVSTAVDNILLLAASSFLVRAKTPVVKWRCSPLEISTRYHVAHGASIYRINLAADPSDVGWEESFGLMTNHVYDIRTLESNQAKYNKKFNSIEIHDAVLQHVPKPRKLELNKEQRERWIPVDPVRKKMIELSQNGKLFRVPLVGPPALGRKQSFHQRLVPKRVRPGLIPPVVPTVGVSGLTVYAKPSAIASKPATIPTYVSRTIKGTNKPVNKGGGQANTNISRSRQSWPDDVEFSLPLTPITQAEKKTKSASQRGKKKKEKATWDS